MDAINKTHLPHKKFKTFSVACGKGQLGIRIWVVANIQRDRRNNIPFEQDTNCIIVFVSSLHFSKHNLQWRHLPLPTHTWDIPLFTVAPLRDQSECKPYFGCFKILLFTCNNLFLWISNCATALCNRCPFLQPLMQPPLQPIGVFVQPLHATCVQPAATGRKSLNEAMFSQPMVCQETILHM